MEFYAAMKKNEMLSFAGKWLPYSLKALCSLLLFVSQEFNLTQYHKSFNNKAYFIIYFSYLL
jgi:hypothetical protein